MLKDFKRDVVQCLIIDGITLSGNGVTICDLRSYNVNTGYRYQVCSENKAFEFSEVYKDLEIAVDKFLGIYNFVRTKHEPERTSGEMPVLLVEKKD